MPRPSSSLSLSLSSCARRVSSYLVPHLLPPRPSSHPGPYSRVRAAPIPGSFPMGKIYIEFDGRVNEVGGSRPTERGTPFVRGIRPGATSIGCANERRTARFPSHPHSAADDGPDGRLGVSYTHERGPGYLNPPPGRIPGPTQAATRTCGRGTVRLSHGNSTVPPRCHHPLRASPQRTDVYACTRHARRAARRSRTSSDWPVVNRSSRVPPLPELMLPRISQFVIDRTHNMAWLALLAAFWGSNDVSRG